MPRVTLTLALLLGAAGLLTGQSLIVSNGGNGADGAFFPGVNTVLDTSVQATYQFTALTIPAGVTVTCVGPVPITIKVLGPAVIDGTLDVSGQVGTAGGNNLVGGPGGAGGPGGGAGGIGGCDAANGFAGTGGVGVGPGGGQPGADSAPAGTGTALDPVGGGGGGGNATAGSPGGVPNSGNAPNVSGSGGPAISPCRAGSGGGGGGCDIDSTTASTSNDGGGGGGGGGGRLCLYSDTDITLGTTGSILANGGAGGASAGNGGAGGGGSGGFIELAAPTINIFGFVGASGGAGGAATQAGCGCSPGGAGGDGCVAFLTDGLTSTAPTTPPAATNPYGLVMTGATPNGSIALQGATGSPYFCALATALMLPGIPFGGQNFVLDVNDAFFNATFPVNTLSPIITGLSGIVPGTISVNLLGIIPSSATFETTLYCQGVVLLATGSAQSTNLVPVYIKF